MAKSKLIINDNFIFTLPKKAPRSEQDFSNEVKELFFNNLNRIKFLDKTETKNLNTPASSWAFNVNDDPLFLFELQFEFSGNKLGGLMYKPEFNLEGDFKIDCSDLNLIEDETEYRFNLNVSASLNWDYKNAEFNKHKAYIEKNLGSTYEEAMLDVRFNIIKNPKAMSCLEFDSSLKNHKGLLENLKQLPSGYSVVYSYQPKKAYELKLPVWQMITDKNVKLESSYLNSMLLH